MPGSRNFKPLFVLLIFASSLAARGMFNMPGSRNFKPLFVLLIIASSLAGCVSSSDYSPILRSEPAAESVLNRAPRTLRLFYDALPDVAQSSLSLTGPDGNYELRGFHTMAADDLMIEILNPSIPDGDYVVSWTTVVGDGTSVYAGSFGFTVATNR